MFYQLLFIHLYRPFLKYTRTNSPLPVHVSPRKLCVQAAIAISKLLRIYRRTYGVKQIVNIAVYIAHTACTIHLLNLPEKETQRDIVHGLKNLEEMGEGWLCARRTIRILEISANKWQANVPNEAVAVFERTHAKWGSWGSWDQATGSSPETGADASPSMTEVGLLRSSVAAPKTEPTESSFMPSVITPESAWPSQTEASTAAAAAEVAAAEEALNSAGAAYYQSFLSPTTNTTSTASVPAPATTNQAQRRMIALPEPTYLRPMPSISYAFQSMPFSDQDIWYNGSTGQNDQVAGVNAPAPSLNMVGDGRSGSGLVDESPNWWSSDQTWPMSAWSPSNTGDMPMSTTPYNVPFQAEVDKQQDGSLSPQAGVHGVWHTR